MPVRFMGFRSSSASIANTPVATIPKTSIGSYFAKTDKYYVKKFEAKTNITGYLAMDLSQSMAYTYRQELTKFDYAICLAASLCYLMVHQQDPCGLVTFDENIRDCIPPKSKRTQLGAVLGHAAALKPAGQTNIGKESHAARGDAQHRSLIMIFSDLLTDPEPVLQSLHRLRHRGHDVILFHILDEAEVTFPFDGLVELEDRNRKIAWKSTRLSR